MKKPIALNPQQVEAIEYGEGPLLIIAGAGTGKTTVITERMRHLMEQKKVHSGNLLALTFTDKASYEMQDRLDILMPYGYSQMWIYTFHSFCDKILRDEAVHIGIDPGYKLISESESIVFLKKNIFNLELEYFRPLGNPNKFLEALLTHFSRLKDEDITPDQYVAFAEQLRSRLKASSEESEKEEARQILELANAYKLYEDLKIQEGLMDFSDLISNTLLLFRTRKNILKKYQNQFQYVLVDEFQDTNFAQNELAILLAGERQNITVVADDDQAIYRWRGAAISNVIQFKKNFPGAKIITLTQNYRSTQAILDHSYMMIQNNNPHRLEVLEKIDKKLLSMREEKGVDPEFIHTQRLDEEAEAIAEKIISLIKTKEYSYKDFAILVRANNHAHSIAETLRRFRIPYQFLGPGQLFHQEEIKDLIAYLKVLSNLLDSVSFYRVLSMEIFGFLPQELNFLFNYSKQKNIPLFDAIGNLDETFLKEETREKLKKTKEMIERHLQKAQKESAGQILYYFLVDSGIYQSLMTINSEQEERAAQNIAKFFDRIKSFESETDDKSVNAVVDWIDLMMQLGESPLAATIDWKDYDAINILTVHSSKGLEFPVVFMVNLVEGRFPSLERREKIPLPDGLIKETDAPEDYHLQEERRLFYVGMTRARDQLFFTASDFYGTGKRAKKISPFVYEALPDLAKQKQEQKKIKQLSLTEIAKPFENHMEEARPVSSYKISSISYSQLQMFDICPLHYKAKVILHVPTPETQVQSFGISMHNTFLEYYKQVQEGASPSLEDFRQLLDKNWISDGYINKKHEEIRREQGYEMVKKYYTTRFNPKNIPLALEFPFTFFLSNGVKVSGVIDRIDKIDGKIEIIDYKTGRNDPKAKKAHELQLAIYALAATRIDNPLLSKDPEDIILKLLFLESGEEKIHTMTSDELKAFEEKLCQQIKTIEKSDFKCSKSILCMNCEYKMLCNASV